MPAPYVKTTEQADPVSYQDLFMAAWRQDRSALPSILLPCNQAEATCAARFVSNRRRHQSSEQGPDTPIDVVWIARWTARPADSQSGALVGAWPTSTRTGRPS